MSYFRDYRILLLLLFRESVVDTATYIHSLYVDNHVVQCFRVIDTTQNVFTYFITVNYHVGDFLASCISYVYTTIVR